MKLTFTKMHALGNDFIFIDNRSGLIRSEKFRLKNIRRISQMLCDRRFGIGADQLLLLDNSKTADFRMRIFNADGSEVEMCGNGIRCAAKYIWDKKLRTKSKEHPVPTALLRKAKQWGDASLLYPVWIVKIFVVFSNEKNSNYS